MVRLLDSLLLLCRWDGRNSSSWWLVFLLQCESAFVDRSQIQCLDGWIYFSFIENKITVKLLNSKFSTSYFEPKKMFAPILDAFCDVKVTSDFWHHPAPKNGVLYSIPSKLSETRSSKCPKLGQNVFVMSETAIIFFATCRGTSIKGEPEVRVPRVYSSLCRAFRIFSTWRKEWWGSVRARHERTV